MGLNNANGNVNPYGTLKKFTDPVTGKQANAPAGFGAGMNYGTGRPGSSASPSMFGSGSMFDRASSAFKTAGASSSFGNSSGGSGVPQFGTESGPGILEDRYNKRASGTDPAFEYLSKRGMGDINTQFAAGGSFNSGARGQQISDFLANLVSQREGQLDSLAGGASGEHQGRLNSMFSQGLGLAGGQANTVAPYASGAAGAMGDAASRDLMLLLNKAGVDANTRTGMLNFLMNLGKSGASIAGGGRPA